MMKKKKPIILKFGKHRVKIKMGDKFSYLVGVFGFVFGIGVTSTIFDIAHYYHIGFLFFVLTAVFGFVFIYKFEPILRKIFGVKT